MRDKQNKKNFAEISMIEQEDGAVFVICIDKDKLNKPKAAKVVIEKWFLIANFVKDHMSWVDPEKLQKLKVNMPQTSSHSPIRSKKIKLLVALFTLLVTENYVVVQNPFGRCLAPLTPLTQDILTYTSMLRDAMRAKRKALKEALIAHPTLTGDNSLLDVLALPDNSSSGLQQSLLMAAPLFSVVSRSLLAADPSRLAHRETGGSVRRNSQLSRLISPQSAMSGQDQLRLPQTQLHPKSSHVEFEDFLQIFEVEEEEESDIEERHIFPRSKPIPKHLSPAPVRQVKRMTSIVLINGRESAKEIPSKQKISEESLSKKSSKRTISLVQPQSKVLQSKRKLGSADFVPQPLPEKRTQKLTPAVCLYDAAKVRLRVRDDREEPSSELGESAVRRLKIQLEVPEHETRLLSIQKPRLLFHRRVQNRADLDEGD